MIQANELRIGNFVKFNAFPLNVRMQIDEIDFEDVLGGYFTDIEPIPLTEEWLIKFGFEKQANYWRRLSICNEWTYIYWEKLSGVEISVNKHSLMLPHIKYVHQLQNLYFTLTGKELTPLH